MSRACSRNGDVRDMYKSLVLNSEGKRFTGRSGRRLKMILEPTFKKWGRLWGLSRSRQGPLTSPCETCDKLTSGNMKEELFGRMVSIPFSRKINVVVVWDMLRCSLAGLLQTLWRKMLSPIFGV